MYTRRDLAARLASSGLEVPEKSIWTSALATARFLEDQRPNGSAFVVGEAGLTTALHSHGYTLTDTDPDYVVLGETRHGRSRAHRQGDPADPGRRALHRDQPRQHRPYARRAAAGHGSGRAGEPRHRRRALLRRQAQPVDDALGVERPLEAYLSPPP